jgi:LPS sulfotransferase NodH
MGVQQRIISGTDGTAKTAAYRPDRRIQEALYKTNESLQTVENSYGPLADSLPDPALVFVAYVPRSGSTLLTQLLARTGQWNYVSNFQSRFWLAPYVGGLLEQSIAPRRYDELPLQSDFGLTPSSGSPAEFSYFWEYWLRLAPELDHQLTHDRWEACDIAGLRRELRLIGSLHQGPLMFKKEWLGMNANHLLDAFPTAKMLHIVRDPMDVARSILKARRQVFGHRDCWWGAKPGNWNQLATLPWHDQIAGQIESILAATNSAIERFSARCLTISYEELVAQPVNSVEQIHAWAELPTTSLSTIPLLLPQSTRTSASAELPSNDEVSQLMGALERGGICPERATP